jgi:hypothetical protein
MSVIIDNYRRVGTSLPHGEQPPAQGDAPLHGESVMIHEGRKRIDITYVNNAASGFFYMAFVALSYARVFVECKNLGDEMDFPHYGRCDLSARFMLNYSSRLQPLFSGPSAAFRYHRHQYKPGVRSIQWSSFRS